MTVLANPSLVAQLSISMTCVSSRGSPPRSRSLRSSLITLRRALPEVGGGRALARKARAGRGPSSRASMAWQGALARGHTKRFCRLSAWTATIQTRGRDCGINRSIHHCRNPCCIRQRVDRFCCHNRGGHHGRCRYRYDNRSAGGAGPGKQ